jgi:hypothetical protein
MHTEAAMSASHRSQRWIWVGRIVFGFVVAGLAIYFKIIGLDKADKFASIIACVLALAALVGPYLLPASQRSTGQDSDIDSAAQSPMGCGLSIDARNSQGVQINQGGQNTQNNNFFESL